MSCSFLLIKRQILRDAYLIRTTRTDKYAHIRLVEETCCDTYALEHQYSLPPFSLQVNTESQMASGAVQNELELKAWHCESLAFHERSVARTRPPESQPAFGKQHSGRNTLIRTILSHM